MRDRDDVTGRDDVRDRGDRAVGDDVRVGDGGTVGDGRTVADDVRVGDGRAAGHAPKTSYGGRIAYALVRHELLLLASLVRWAVRRPHGAGGGADGRHGGGDVGEGRSFGYARGQSALMLGLAFVCVVETAGMSVLLRDWPTAHLVVLVLDVYTVVFVLGLHAACVTRPHVLDGTALRVRSGVRVDLRIPLADIAAVRRELRATHESREGELNLAIGAQTSVTLELAAPVAHFTFLGRRQDVRLVRLHADAADELLQAVRQARTVPSPFPDPPG